jgi:hypothetical protein
MTLSLWIIVGGVFYALWTNIPKSIQELTADGITLLIFILAVLGSIV